MNKCVNSEHERRRLRQSLCFKHRVTKATIRLDLGMKLRAFLAPAFDRGNCLVSEFEYEAGAVCGDCKEKNLCLCPESNFVASHFTF
jgi:hypothetical protein